MKIFLDTEFAGLYNGTQLISIGIIGETGNEFYKELNDYDKDKLDPWIKENVVANLSGNPEVVTDMKGLKKSLTEWLVAQSAITGKQIEVISDCLSYDWVLFNEIFGGALNIPDCVNYIPTDICTMFRDRGIDPDISREEFSGTGSSEEKHNSLYDAKIIKVCYEKLKSIKLGE